MVALVVVIFVVVVVVVDVAVASCEAWLPGPALARPQRSLVGGSEGSPG